MYSVSIYSFYINIVEYYMKTIYDMQNEKDYSYHCVEFEQNVVFRKLYEKVTLHYWFFEFQIISYICLINYNLHES